MARTDPQTFVVPQRLPSAPAAYNRANEQETRRIIELALRQKAIPGNAGGTPGNPLATAFNLQRKNVFANLSIKNGDTFAEGFFLLHTDADPALGRLEEDEAGALLLEIQVHAPAWLRLYAHHHDQIADRDRASNDTDYPLHACLLDVVTGDVPNEQKYRLFDQGVEGVHIINRDDPAENRIYFRVDLDPSSFEDGIFVASFGAIQGRDCSGHEFVLESQGTSATVYGFRYAGPSVKGFFCDGGFDAYWVSWIADGIRSRTWDDGPQPAQLYPPAAGLTGRQTSQIVWSPLPNDSVESSWSAAHCYCLGDTLGRLELGVVRSGAGFGHSYCEWRKLDGTVVSLSTDTSADIDVHSARQMTTEVTGSKVRVYIDGVLDREGDLPTEFTDATVFGRGLLISGGFVPSATFAYGGIAVLTYGVSDTFGYFVPITLGYAPTEHIGGTIGLLSYEDDYEG